MSNLLTKIPERIFLAPEGTSGFMSSNFSGTEAGSSMGSHKSKSFLVHSVFFFFPEGTSSKKTSELSSFLNWDITTSVCISETKRTLEPVKDAKNLDGRGSEATRKAVLELRRLSGLTWEHLASIFQVSRRSLHFWASGQPLSSSNEKNLYELLSAIKYIDRQSASINRSLLLAHCEEGKPIFDLLVEGKYEEVKKKLGAGNAPIRPHLGSLSSKELLLRKPQNPSDLVDALQDPIHKEVGRSRPAKTVRSRRSCNEQSRQT